MTEYAYDPDLPFVVAYSPGDKPLCRFRTGTDAGNYIYHYLSEGLVFDTTPKPKIPVDAQHITWGSGTTAYSRTSGGWVGWTHGEVISEERLLGMIWDHKVTVLVPKEAA